jgi:uncharacterized protein
MSGGHVCAAWLYAPENGEPPYPCVVLGHGLGGVREARLDAFAERFAAAGIAALVFDYRHFGDSEGEPRQLVDIGRQLDDWRAAINFARMLTVLDASRLAVWGTSFGGGHVATIASEDLRLAAAISQVPFVDGLATSRAGGSRHALRLTAAGVRDELGRLLRRPPHMVPLVGPPGSLAAMTSPDAEPGYRALFASDGEFRNEVAARVFLRLTTYRPAVSAPQIACPWLVCVCEHDAVTPPAPAEKAAARAPRGEVRRYDAQHFDIYVGETFEAAVADQAEFLRRHLVAS